jgi:alpha-glucosidase
MKTIDSIELYSLSADPIYIKYKHVSYIAIALLISIVSVAQKSKSYLLSLPDGTLVLQVNAIIDLQWSVTSAGHTIIAPSGISLQLASGENLGRTVSVATSKTTQVRSTFNAINYKKKVVKDEYNQLVLNCKGDYGVIFRAYNDGVAYRFFTNKKGELAVTNEEVSFNFDQDYKCLLPFVRDLRGQEQYVQSYEALYDNINISKIKKVLLVFYTCCR